MQPVDIGSVAGLSGKEAGEKLQSEGYNELPSQQKRSIFWIIFEVIHEPMFLLLVASGLIYFALGDVTEGIMLMSFVVVIIGITAAATTWANYSANRRHVGEAVISLDGVYLNRQAHIWKGIGTRLEGIAFEDSGRPQPVILIEYSALGGPGGSRNSYSVRVPVPEGQEEKAKDIVARIRQAHPSG